MQVITVPVMAKPKESRFSIPAGNDQYRVRGKVQLETDARLYVVLPHMHRLGKSIRISFTPPGESEQLLIAIDDWDYRWQEIYMLKQPLSLKAGTVMSAEGVFDNSAGNPNQPFDHPKIVKEGAGAADEMVYGFIGATADSGGEIKVKELGKVVGASAKR